MSLKDDLQEIDGIGPAKAEKIMAVVQYYDGGGVSESDVRKALRFADNGHMAGCAETLRDVLE